MEYQIHMEQIDGNGNWKVLYDYEVSGDAGPVLTGIHALKEFITETYGTFPVDVDTRVRVFTSTGWAGTFTVTGWK